MPLDPRPPSGPCVPGQNYIPPPSCSEPPPPEPPLPGEPEQPVTPIVHTEPIPVDNGFALAMTAIIIAFFAVRWFKHPASRPGNRSTYALEESKHEGAHNS